MAYFTPPQEPISPSTMASGQPSDLGPQKTAGSLPIYQSSPVVHVPYSGNIGNTPSPAIQHRPVVQGGKVGQSTAVIQKATPASLPSKVTFNLLLGMVYKCQEISQSLALI